MRTTDFRPKINFPQTPPTKSRDSLEILVIVDSSSFPLLIVAVAAAFKVAKHVCVVYLERKSCNTNYDLQKWKN